MKEMNDYTESININKITLENALAISSLTQIVSRTSTDIDKLIKHAEKIDKVIMNNSKLEDRVDDLEVKVASDRKSIDIVYAILKYPKATASVLLLSYVLTIEDVRTAIVTHIKPVVDIIKAIGLT